MKKVETLEGLISRIIINTPRENFRYGTTFQVLAKEIAKATIEAIVPEKWDNPDMPTESDAFNMCIKEIKIRAAKWMGETK